MPRGKTVGAKTTSCYKWKISVIDLDTNIQTTDKYYTISHFNDIHKTNYSADTVQKLKKLHIKIGDYTIDDIKNAIKKKPCSVLAQYGHLNFVNIKDLEINN